MINVWLALTDDAKQIINTCLATPPQEYSGPVTQDTREVFENAYDVNVVQRMFKTPSVGGKTYHLYNFYVLSEDAQKTKDVIDSLVANYPGKVIVMGVWRSETGEQLSAYPLHAQLINFMPDVEGLPATVLRDVNRLAGQSQRDFN